MIPVITCSLSNRSIPSYSVQELRKICSDGRVELETYLHDVHGDKPIFEYPIMSFGDLKNGEDYHSFGK